MQETRKNREDFLFDSHFVEVLGSKIHYIDEGQGDPIVFLHGIPTWSYLWRNIIPQLSHRARCIAPDLIGMGRSDKPDIKYRVFDHIYYIEAFIEALALKNITFVMHAWGAVIGFDYAKQHEDNVKGLAFLEALLRPTKELNTVSLPLRELTTILHNPDGGYKAIIEDNYFMKTVFPNSMMRSLTTTENNYYQEPYSDPSSRRPIWQYLKDLPLDDGPDDVLQLIEENARFLQKTSIPKLMFYAIPGFNTPVAIVQWAKDNLPNLKIVEIDDALHYAQENNPEHVAAELVDWYASL